MEDFIFADFNATCHTAECENADITICISAVIDAPYVVCGPCGQRIEDVIPVG